MIVLCRLMFLCLFSICRHKICPLTRSNIVQRMKTNALHSILDVLNGVVWKYARAQAQILGRLLFQIDEQIAEWHRRRVVERFVHVLHATRVHMSHQVRYLRLVAGILEHHHVVSVQTDGGTLLVFREQVLHEVED